MGKALIALLVFIVAIHAAGILNSWYFAYPWLDVPMHFLGGAWAVFFLFWIFEKRNDEYLLASPKWISFIFALGFAAFVGALWEFFEFFFDVFISSRGYAYVAQLSSADTTGDLFFDLAGGFFAWVVVLLQKKSEGFDYVLDKDGNY